MRQRLVIEIGDGEFRAQPAKSLGAALGNRLVVGDARHQASLASQGDRGGRDHASAPADRNRLSVWRAIIRSSFVGMT
jgi:hypothetical protein